MRAAKKSWVFWVVMGSFAVAIGWRLYEGQRHSVPAVPTILQAAVAAAEQASPLNRCALLERAGRHWLELGQKEQAQRLMPALLNAATDLNCRCEEREQRLLNIAMLWLELGNPDEAKRAAQQALGKTTVFLMDRDALVRFFQALLQRISPEEAYRWVETLPHESPEQRPEQQNLLLIALGQAAAAHGALDFAERTLRTVAPLPQDYAEMAYWFRQHGRQARADALTREAIRLYEAQPDAYTALNLARTLQRMGRTAEAEQVIQNALRRIRDLSDSSLLELAKIAYELNRPALARTLLQRALDTPSRPRELEYRLADYIELLQHTGMLDAATNCLRQSPEPLAYARFLIRLGRLDEAVQVAQTSTRTPIFPELLDALLQAGRTEEAERLTLRSPAPETVAQQWARYYAQQGDVAKAVEQIQRVPDHKRTFVQQAVLEALVEAGYLSQAKRFAQQVAEAEPDIGFADFAAPIIARGYLQRKEYGTVWRLARAQETPDIRAKILLDLVDALRAP